MMKNLLLSFKKIGLGLALLVGMLVLVGNAWGQTTGDYRSNSASSFNWSSTTAWQRFNGSAWANDGTYPGQNSGTGTVTVTGNITCTINASVPNAIGSLVVGNGTIATTLRFERNLTLSLDINGDLSVSANSSFSIRTRNGGTPVNSLTVGGNILNNGTLNMTNSTYSSTVYLDGTNQTISGSNTPTFRDLSISGNGTTTLTRNISITGNLNVETGAALDLSTFTANRSTTGGTLTVAGTLLVGGTNNFPTNYGTFTATGGTVNYDNNGAQTIGNQTYNNLTLSGSGLKTENTATVNGILSMEGTATASAAPTYGSSATLQYKGSSTQAPGPEFTNSFNGTGGIIIDNENGVTLGSAESIGSASKLTLVNGILTTTSTNLLSVTNTSSSSISGGSATSFISGPVSWSLPASLPSGSTYEFPVGKGTAYLPFILGNPTTGTGTITAQVEAFAANSNGSIDATLNSISSTEYWALTTSGNFTNSSISVDRNSAISPYDVIAGSTTLTGTYTSLDGTAGSTGVSGSNTIGTNRYFVLAERKQAITTGVVSTSPFCVSASTSASGTVAYTSTGVFSGATFTAKLSDASGSFASPTSIGTATVSGSNQSGTINITIPAGTVSGTGYKIRIDCSSPAITGSESAAFTVVNGVSNVTSFSASDDDASSSLSWTNPTDCYDEVLIVAKANSSVTGTPAGDGSAYIANLNFGSGTSFGGGYVVYKGTSSPQTISGLTNGTTYYLKAFTRNGNDWSSGVEITANPSSASLATDYFRSKTSGNWNLATTWESSHDGVTWFNATLTPASSANAISILDTHTVTVSGSVSVDQTTILAGGKVIVNSGQTLTVANGSGTDLTIAGTLVNSGTITATGTLAFNDGSIYEHAQNGGTIPPATWNVGSLLKVTGITTTIVKLPSVVSGSIEWNCPGQTVSGDIYTSVSGGATFSVGQNFTISNTNSGTVSLFNLNGQILNIGGDYSQSGNLTIESGGTSDVQTVNIDGSFLLNSGTLNFSSNTGNTINLNVKGNWTQEGGSITETSTSICIVSYNGTGIQVYSKTGGTISNTINFTVNSGSTLDLGNSVIDGSNGTFTLSSGAGIFTAHAQGLSTTASTGSVQVTGTKSYSTTANYTYNGSSAQVTGNALTGASNLTFDNSSGVSLSSAVSVSGTLTLTSGKVISTSTNLLSVTNTSSSAISGGSATSFISGPVRWSLPASLPSGSTYEFPVGKGTAYLPFILGNPTTGTGAITTQVEAFASNSGGSFDATLDSKSTSEYWTLTTVGNFTNSSVSVDRGSAISPYDVIAGATLQSGTYTSLEGTAGSTGVSNSDLIGSNRFFVLAEKKKNTITTGTISGSPFCQGASVTVPFTISGTYNSGNIFTAQLSDASGSFTSPVAIGSLTSTSAGTISATIPVATIAGTGYRIRVVSNNPSVTGSDNGINLTVIEPIIVDVSIAANQNSVCSGSSVTYTATPTNGGLTPVYQWKVNGTNVGSSSATYSYTPANGDVITCVLTSSETCVSGNPATSNAVTMTVYAIPAVTNSPTKTICNGSSTNMTLTATTASSYSWTIGTIVGGITGASAGSGSSIDQVLTNPSNSSAGSVQYIVTPTSTTGSCVGSPFTITVTVQSINALVTDISDELGSDCPDFGDFNPNTASYNPGYSVVKFRVVRDLSSSAWNFDYNLTGGVVYSGSPEVASATKSIAVGTSSVDMVFYIANTPGAAQNIVFKVVNVSDSNCSNNGINRTVTHTILAMPAIGSFN